MEEEQIIPSKYQPSYLNRNYHEQTCFQIQYGSKFLNIHPIAVEYTQELKRTPAYGRINPYTEMFVTDRIPTKERIDEYYQTDSSPVLPIGYIKEVNNGMSIFISMEDWRKIRIFFSENLRICFKCVLEYMPGKKINFETCEIISATNKQDRYTVELTIVCIDIVEENEQ